MNKKIKEFLIPFMKIDEHRRLISSIACQYSDEEFEEKVTKEELQDIITHLMEIVSIKTNSLKHDNVEELHVIEELTNILSLKI